MFEWRLKTSVTREFDVTRSQPVLVQVTKQPGEAGNSGKLPLLVMEERIHTETAEVLLPADRVRMSHSGHDRRHHRFSVRFHYGRLDESGKWQPAKLDAGVVFGGPTYLEHGFHQQDHDEKTLLVKCAAVCGWDGELVEIHDEAPAK